MIYRSIARWIIVFPVIAFVFAVSQNCNALTILSGPSFTPATNAPLAGVLQLTTDVRSRISVTASDGTDFWQRDFYDYETSHSLPLLGFKPGRTNLILVAAYDKDRNVCYAPESLTFVTPLLPATFPTSTVLKSDPDEMERGYTFFMIRNNTAKIGYIVILDNLGEVVWYMKCPNVNDADVRRLDNGDVFIPPISGPFTEINMLGQTVKTWNPPAGYPINDHDGFPTDHGTILYLSDKRRVVTNFPSSTSTNATFGTVNVDDNPVVEISITNSSLLNSWSPLDLLDPTRVTYCTYGRFSGSSIGVDNLHANAVREDTNDNSIIVSLRNQNAVFKFSRETGQLKWILGSHANWGANWQQYLLTPVGTPFDWNYGQHAPEITPQGSLLIYNDNNYRADPFDPPLSDQENYSSAIEYSINETNMEVSEVWNSAWQTNQDRLFTPFAGKVTWLPESRNVLVTYSAVSFVNEVSPSTNATNATLVRLIEYTHDPVPQVVFDIDFFDHTNTSPSYSGYFCYRAYHIPDLYPHLAKPVTDLVVREVNQLPRLEFAADPTHSYLVQASTDQTNWITIGAAGQEEVAGYFVFEDLDANQFTARFYRVVTQ